MAPQTRNSAKNSKAKSNVKKDLPLLNSGSAIKKKKKVVVKEKDEPEEREECRVVIKVVDSERSGTDTESDVSSSSAEDSDDDFELELMNKKSMYKGDTQDSSNAEDNDDALDIETIERKIDQELRKKRLILKEKKKNTFTEDDGLICEFESSGVQKNRKRRLFRRRLFREPGVPKRRRIKRTSVDVTTEYKCDSFADFGYTVACLTTEIQRDDVEIDMKALDKLFRLLNADNLEPADISSEEDDTDFIVEHLNIYQTRNAQERVKQVSELEMNPFSEKLSGYSGSKTSQGFASSLVQNYHPQMFRKSDLYKLPQCLIWDRPFKHLIYQQSRFDVHQDTNDFLNRVLMEKKAKRESVLLDEIKQSVVNKMVDIVDTKVKVKKLKIEQISPSQSFFTPRDHQTELSHVELYNRPMSSFAFKKVKHEVPDDAYICKEENINDEEAEAIKSEDTILYDYNEVYP